MVENKSDFAILSKYYAHSLPEQPVSRWEPLDQHLLDVADLSKKFASKFDSGEWGWNAGILHDLGKAMSEFQAYLKKENNIPLDDGEYDLGRINHSSAGSAFAEKKWGLLGRPLSAIIAGHHAGLPDFDSGNASAGDLISRLTDGQNQLSNLKVVSEVIQNSLCELRSFPDWIHQSHHSYHLWVRMVFSCLVDSDYLNTEHFMDLIRSKGRDSGKPMSDLGKALDEYFITLNSNSKPSPVNDIRREILETCKDAAELSPGLFTLTVPTGGGKTLSSTAFALKHAMKYGKDRIIYVIPYTSIIEQNAMVLKRVFGDDDVIEHHSNIDPERETQRMRLASENWDARIVVTTNVQFFESLFAAKTSRCRKLHNLVNSVIILDEAQMVPPEKLEPCVHVLNQLANNYGATIVLSTATQPALPKLTDCREIIPPNLKLFERLKRTEYIFPNDLGVATEWGDIRNQLLDHSQVLCIVNTRKDCYDLYQMMPDDTIHLSALMCGEHRSSMIHLIKKKLKEKEPVRVISTQLVEAGVDLDFPVVFRALAGMDSIAQAAGRCNREGQLAESGKVYIFTPPKPAPPGLLRKGEQKTKELLLISDLEPDSPETFTKYFDLFYSSVNDKGEGYLKMLSENVQHNLDVPFRTVGKEFRLIDDEDSVGIFVRYGKGENLINKLKHSGPDRFLMRKLQRFSVRIHQKMADNLLMDGFIEEIIPGVYIQLKDGIYSETYGLDIFDPKLSPEDTILESLPRRNE